MLAVLVGFIQKNQTNPLAWLAPKDRSFYQSASEHAILQKALTLILVQGLYDRRVIQLCLELTKHHLYQQAERDYQKTKNNYEKGLLSNCSNRKSVVLCFARVFSQSGYQFIFPNIKSARENRGKLRTPVSQVGVYMRGFS